MREAVLDIQKIRLLVVDDNLQAVRLVRMLLHDLGCTQIYTAKDGREALEFLGACDELVDGVISDWNMPRMPGIELLRQVRTVYPEMPFLMLTGRATIDAVKEARTHGVTAYLAKPFSPDQLQQKVLHLVRKCPRESPAPV